MRRTGQGHLCITSAYIVTANIAADVKTRSEVTRVGMVRHAGFVSLHKVPLEATRLRIIGKVRPKIECRQQAPAVLKSPRMSGGGMKRRDLIRAFAIGARSEERRVGKECR